MDGENISNFMGVMERMASSGRMKTCLPSIVKLGQGIRGE